MLKRKQITFDLDTKVLKQIHGEKNYTKAYTDIRSFMENNGFEHLEGSVYASTDNMSNHKILKTIKKLKGKHAYLEKSVKELHQTDVGESHSLSEQFDYDGTPGKYAQKKPRKSAETTQNTKTATASASVSQAPDYRKQITFDLDTGVLKQIHDEQNYTKAYTDIRSFMESSGFEHIEGSAYASKSIMSNQEIIDLLEDLKEKHAYLEKSVKAIHQTDIGKTHSMSGQFDYDGTPGKYAQKINQNAAPKMNVKRRLTYLQYLTSQSGAASNNTEQANIADSYTPP